MKVYPPAASYTNIRGGNFIGKLEEYIDRTRHNLGKGDSTVPEELGVKLSLSNDFLSRTDPTLLKKYSGYVTAFSYDKRGRFVSNLDDSFTQTARLTPS